MSRTIARSLSRLSSSCLKDDGPTVSSSGWHYRGQHCKECVPETLKCLSGINTSVLPPPRRHPCCIPQHRAWRQQLRRLHLTRMIVHLQSVCERMTHIHVTHSWAQVCTYTTFIILLQVYQTLYGSLFPSHAHVFRIAERLRSFCLREEVLDAKQIWSSQSLDGWRTSVIADLIYRAGRGAAAPLTRFC